MKGTQRLDKILANSGFGTRSEVKKIIKRGNVVVDGNTIKDSSKHVNPINNEIIVNGEKLEYKEYIYIMLNKPQDVITATTDSKFKTVIDLLPDEYTNYNLFPIGRLDKDTEGLLILTDDGKLSHQLLSPRNHVPKTYYVLIQGKVTEKDIEIFKEGVILDDDYKTLPANLNILKSQAISEVEITIFEGKFHQVKRMFESVGKKVKYLKRIKMGDLDLDKNLMPGEYKEITEKELKLLKNIII